VRHSHGVASALAAVHDIRFILCGFDAETREPIVANEFISVDLEENMDRAAIAAAINWQTQRERIVYHIAAVMRGWLGFGLTRDGNFTALADSPLLRTV